MYNYGVVVVYECGDGLKHQEVVPLNHDFGTIDGWNEMMSKQGKDTQYPMI